MRLKLHLRCDSARDKSTPVYEMNRIIGRDFPNGASFRLMEEAGQVRYLIKLADGSSRSGMAKTSAGASRVACGIILGKMA